MTKSFRNPTEPNSTSAFVKVSECALYSGVICTHEIKYVNMSSARIDMRQRMVRFSHFMFQTYTEYINRLIIK